MEPIINRPLPIGVVFRPTKFEMANIFLKKRVLGQSIEAPRVPGDCHDIFSRRLRELPGYPREEHWYYFCRRRRNQVTSSNLWTPTGEETNVLDPKNRRLVVATRRRFTLLEKQEGEEYDWFLDEIRLPPTVSHSDWVLCHILGKKIEPEIEYFPPLIESEYDESESEDEESVDT
ncbi:PREDICTED: NAC domain-containing protein 14-like [Camelina sativa]|uniref:NAC domain-containing protein 14-like n=1 Tax=Camelina sativa TaxID=90675 RepID=A0ABM0YWT3_CAMSA|nr:PREDICTED: NAC domain-containing protein 14-like [Camelina sativa]